MDSKRYQEGIKLFNRAAFFEAHEVLEDVWRVAPEGEKKFLQGLIQVAVALHHHSRGNSVGARSLLGRASRNLSAYPEQHAGIALQSFRLMVTKWQHALAEGKVLPELPKIQPLDSSPQTSAKRSTHHLLS